MKKSISQSFFLMQILAFISLTLFISSSINAQVKNDYNNLWTKVEGHRTDGRTNSALEITEDIYKKAIEEGRDDQRIKAIIYKNIFRSVKEENATEKSIWEMEAELELAEGSAKAILHSAIAQLYWWHYSQNRWNIHDRSGAKTEDKMDLSTWSTKEIIEKINEHFVASVIDAEILQKTSPSEFDVILDKSERGRIFRPTLYDVLAWRLINFYANSESGLTRPKDQFLVNDEQYYSSLEKFAILQIDQKDSLSFELKAVLCYQKLLAFHINSTYKDALYYTDLQRLNFVKSRYNTDNSDELYLDALEALKERSTDSVKAEVMYAIAKHYRELGQRYRSGSEEENRWYLTKSLSICKEVISIFPRSNGASECKNLAIAIEKKNLTIKTESVVSSKADFLAFFEYQNIEEVHFRIIENKEKLQRSSGRDRNFNLKEFALKPALYAGSFTVPDSGDHQVHSVEYSFPKLKAGYYSILTSLNKDFSTENNLMVKNDFWVSDLAYFQMSETDGEVKVYVVDRHSGLPLPNVSAQLYIEEYNYQNRENDLVASGKAVSDEKGKISLKNEERNVNYRIMLAKGKDSLLISSPVYLRKASKPKEKTITKTYMFTDRQIYRPGQRIYFKGIVMEKKGFELKLKEGKDLNVSIFDVNNEEVGSVSLMTNEFGTYHGSFELPLSGLTGKYYVTDGNSRHYISVEQYKRPTFRIETDSLKGNYKVGETVSFSGKAIAWNGSPVLNALVKYTVLRRTSWPFWNNYHMRYPSTSSDEIIDQGEIKSDRFGKWNFEFKAIPDPRLKRKYKPVYQYVIGIEVTDINGETQNSQASVKVGYESLMLSMNLSDEMEFSEADTLIVTTSNLQGGFTPAMVEVSFFRLEAPTNLERRKLWPIPEYKLLDSATYKGKHILDHYSTDQQLSNWLISEKAIATTINTEDNRRIVPKNIDTWVPGAYMVRLTSSDPYGNGVSWEKRFILYSSESKDLPQPSWMWIRPLKETYHVGETAEILVGSSKKNATLFYSFRDKSGLIKESWLKLTGKVQRIGIPIIENYRGNLAVQFFLVHSGRSYKFDQVIQVPYDNKKLSLKLETYRSVLEPGGLENWKLVVKAKDENESSTKEVLVSMYDMSLDAFEPNNWSFGVYQMHHPTKTVFTGNNFDALNGRSYSFFRDKYARHKPWKYDDLNWFGLNIYGYQGRMAMTMDYETANEEDGINTNGNATKTQYERLPTRSVARAKSVQVNNEASFQLRRDFRETAFFYPELETDSNGSVTIEFQVPDALTKWKFQALAISKDIEIGIIEEQVVTKKDLMIMPNYPRFLTTGDTIVLSAKIVNVSDKFIEGFAKIEASSYLDQNEESLELISAREQKFNLGANSSAAVSWKLACSNRAGLVEVKIFAESENHKDGELKIIPLLSNEVLMTDTYPVTVRSGKKKSVEITHLTNEKMQIERPYRYSLEFTANPSWYVIQALPYLSDHAKKSSEDLFNRFFANSVGLGIIIDNQEISKVFEAWKMDPNTALSNLEINQELKQVLLSESPWLMEAKNETENKRKLGKFFDYNNLEQNLKATEKELLELQSPNGGWPWFKGMRDSRHITQNIVGGFAKLDSRDFWDIRNNGNLWSSLQLAVNYLDQRIIEDYNKILARKSEKNIYVGNQHIQYLYARSFYKDVQMSEEGKKAHTYFLEQAKVNWLKSNKYLQAMLAVVFLRNEDRASAEKIMISLKENALYSEEFGMYWKTASGYFWHESDLGRQAMLIEAFDEIMNDTSSVEEMKVWLLKQKQSRMWRTSKETTEACWALLTKGQNNLSLKGEVSIKIGGKELDQASIQKEAGSGYFKKTWLNSDIKENMAHLEIENKGESMSWGAAYYQYYGEADKADLQSSGLSVTKEYYKIGQSDQGLTYDKVTGSGNLTTADRILVRLIIKSDRVLDYVHLKDRRASGLEPVDTKSGFRYNNGSGYYLSVRDASHNFFFNQIIKGTFVLEYELKANNSGDFSAGFAQIQCYYAPEFSARSKGSRLVVD